MTCLLKKFFKDESGATAIEYGLIAGLLCLGVTAALTGAKTQLNSIFTSLTSTMSSVQ